MTSNPYMKGIMVTKQEGAIVNSIIKLNYIFTISKEAVKKILFSLSEGEKKLIRDELMKRLF